MSGIQSSVSSANRYHIGIFGKMNAGKSSFINCLSGQATSIVSDIAGTTTDVVKKPMEIHGIGACVIYDTAGFDDTGALGEKRTQATQKALSASDLAVIVFCNEKTDAEDAWIENIRQRNIPLMGVLTHIDEHTSEYVQETIAKLEKKYRFPVLPVNCISHKGIEEVRNQMVLLAKGNVKKRTVLQGLVKAKDTVVLVMPQDPQAPEGRLIQPEVMTIRDALDKDCITVCVTPESLQESLNNMKVMPKLIVTDSQVFRQVYDMCPKETGLTSFSVLTAALKGDIHYLSESAKAIASLNEDSRVLIAECCSHAPMEEDIGRVKIPAMLRKKAGENLHVDVVAGTDFPDDAAQYDLIIQCGGCMFNRRYIMSRIDSAKKAGIPMTNYGIAIAYLSGILEHVILPEETYE